MYFIPWYQHLSYTTLKETMYPTVWFNIWIVKWKWIHHIFSTFYINGDMRFVKISSLYLNSKREVAFWRDLSKHWMLIFFFCRSYNIPRLYRQIRYWTLYQYWCVLVKSICVSSHESHYILLNQGYKTYIEQPCLICHMLFSLLPLLDILCKRLSREKYFH